MEQIKKTILIVDNDQDNDSLEKVLVKEGYTVVRAGSGSEALHQTKILGDLALMITEIEIAGIDGIMLIKLLRKNFLFGQLPIIVASGRNLQSDKVVALDLGADDYMKKPVDTEELLARMRALLRRSQYTPKPFSQRISLGLGCVFDQDQYCLIFSDGEVVKLTLKEYLLLSLLVENAGNLVSHRNILSSVWGVEYMNDENYIWTYIRRIRSKLRDNAKTPKLLFTEPGIGYRFTPDVKVADRKSVV